MPDNSRLGSVVKISTCKHNLVSIYPLKKNECKRFACQAVKMNPLFKTVQSLKVKTKIRLRIYSCVGYFRRVGTVIP